MTTSEGTEVGTGIPATVVISEASGNTVTGVISDSSATYVLEALQKVVKEGTGKEAEILGFSEGGKTGTVHKTKRGAGYIEDSYRASFIGITPLNEQSLTIFVSIDEPGLNAYSGGAVAAPVFAKIAESSLNHLGYFEDE